MKSVILFLSLATLTARGKEKPQPNDSLRIAKDIPLDEIVITATRAAESTPIAFTDVSKEELSKRNNGQGIPYLISQSPSVIMTSDDGTGIGYSGFRIRGTDANRINVTVNGVPVNDAESHTLYWVNMPDFASSVENLQIQRGVGTSTNGAAAFGATISMQTQRPEMKPYGEYSLSAGSFGTVKHTAKGGTGLLHDHFIVDARYSDVQSDGYIDRASAKMSSYFLSAAYYADNTLLKFQTFGSDEKTYQAWNGVPSYILEQGNRTYNPCGAYMENGVEKFYDNQTDNYRQQHYHLLLSQRLGSLWNMNATLHYTPGEGYYEDYRANNKYSSFKLPNYIDSLGNEQKKSDFVRRKWVASDFYGAIYSATYQNNRMQLTLGGAINRYEANHYGRIIWAKAANSLPDPNYEYYRNQGKKTDYSAYAKTTYQLLPSVSGFLDLQYRGIDYTVKGSDDKAGDQVDISKNWNFFNPKVGVNFLQGGHQAFASFSIANREPNRRNFIEASPNEYPTYETLYDYETGYSFYTSIFRAGVNLYYMSYDNQLILNGKISDIGTALTTNIKDSYRMGIELIGGVKPASWLNWSGSVTLSRNKIRNFTEYVDDWDTGTQQVNELGTTSIAFSPEVIANSMFEFTYKQFSAGFNTQYVGRQYMDNTESKDRSVDPYLVNSLRLGYVIKPRFMKEIGLDLTINNLFNEKYETNGWVYSYIEGGVRKKDDGYFTQAGTSAMARLTIKL